MIVKVVNKLKVTLGIRSSTANLMELNISDIIRLCVNGTSVSISIIVVFVLKISRYCY